jgi:UDP-2-acetamido-2,6-beta-L-arabino-hexul-4-ose reductase
MVRDWEVRAGKGSQLKAVRLYSHMQAYSRRKRVVRVIIEEVSVHCDARGTVFEPLSAEALGSQRNVHVVITEPGAVRANHYHTRGIEVLTVYGPALVRCRQETEISDTLVAEKRVFRFTIPAGVSHAVLNTGHERNILVAFNTEIHDRSHPDVVSDALIGPQDKSASNHKP